MATETSTESRHGRDEVQRAMSSEIQLLSGLLDDTIRRLAGASALALFEEVRAAARALRASHSPEEARWLRDRLGQLELADLRTLGRAFSVTFDLINLAEQRARLRALRLRALEARGPLTESLEAALLQMRERGISAARVAELLEGTRVVPVFTAHPSEARRRTILDVLAALSSQLDRLEYSQLLPHQRRAAESALAREVETFWLSSLVRFVRPTPLDEVRQGLGAIAALFDVVPRLYRELEAALRRSYPESGEIQVATLLRFGSWIGGDRDGNPNVTHTVTAEAVKLQQQTVLGHYLGLVEQLTRQLSHSDAFVTPTPEFLEALRQEEALLRPAPTVPDHEPYRRRCRAVAARLQRTLEHTRTLQVRWTEDPAPPPPGVYRSRRELLDELRAIVADLRHNGAVLSAEGLIHDLIRLVDVFGLHMLTLDVREHSGRLNAALDEILARTGVAAGYRTLPAEERFALLAAELEQRRPLLPVHLPFSDETREVVQTFRTIAAVLEQQCPEAIENYIISGAEGPADLLAVLVLAREAGLYRPADGVSRLNIVPLFEAQAPLIEARPIVERLLTLPAYRRHLRLRGDVQEVMIGYSDSNKESGILQSSWLLYQAQRALVELGRQHGVRVQIFHGRGGAIGRGGGPANHAILAQPAGTVEGRLRFTEQGEMIADRYGTEGVAERHLEQILHAVLTASFVADARPSPDWLRLLEQLAGSACRHYRAMVYETPEFLDYFNRATPISEIGQLKIASRPARRGGQAVTGIDQLRAIPWVFSWMQSRHTLPGWYGLGSAVQEHLARQPQDRATLATMYEQWPFWRTLIDNVQMVLSKADMTIARLYADLVPDQALAGRIYDRIEAEHRRTVEMIGQITGHDELLAQMPVLRRSIQQRNPYVDPLSFIQLVLLRRLREADDPPADLLTGVLESISGIASGLKNTG